MRKKTTHKIIILMTVSIAIYTIILNKIEDMSLLGGNWNIISTQIISYIPYIIGIALGFIFIIKDEGYGITSSGRLFLLTGITGVFFSGLFYELNVDGIWINEFITASFTIGDLQIVTVLFFMFLGILIGLIKR